MRRCSKTVRLVVAAALLAATLVVGANAASSGATGRQPQPDGWEFHGGVGPGGANGWGQIVIQTFEDKAFWVAGEIPGTCRKDDKTFRAGLDGAIDVMFQGYTGEAPIAANGSFGFTMKRGKQAGGASAFVVTVRGTFHGNSVVGRVKGRSGPDPMLGSCTGDAAFWAKRYAKSS